MPLPIKSFRSPRENLYNYLMIAIGLTCWLGLVRHAFNKAPILNIPQLQKPWLMILLALYVLMCMLGWLYRATAFGNMTLLSETQCPKLYQMIKDGALQLGLKEVPIAFLYNSNGLLNAFARRMWGGNYIFLTSALVDATDDEQVRFVIGHELGHIAAGHIDTIANFIKFPAHFTPFLGKAYSRAREYTCDAIGAHLANNEKASCQALQVLGCGCKRFSLAIDTQAFAAQEYQVPAVAGFIHEILSTHPRLTRRVLAIIDRKRSTPLDIADMPAYKIEFPAGSTQAERPKGFADV